MIINVKNIPELSELPLRATPKSAAYDVFAVAEPEIVGEKVTPLPGTEDVVLWKRIDYIQYRTALYTAPEKDTYGKDYHVLVHPRSSVSKYNLILANGIGLIDTDYRGEYLIRYKYVFQPEDLSILTSVKPDFSTTISVIAGKVNEDKIYKKGDRVAQLVVEPTTEAEWVRVEDLDKTERTGGFGSTDDVKSIPIGQTNTITISKEAADKKTIELIKKIKPLPGIKPVEHEKNYETHVDLIDQWKKAGGISERPSTGYEKLIKEREKQLGATQ